MKKVVERQLDTLSFKRLYAIKSPVSTIVRSHHGNGMENLLKGGDYAEIIGAQ